MKIVKWLVAILSLLVMPCGLFAAEGNTTVIQLDSGPIRGKIAAGGKKLCRDPLCGAAGGESALAVPAGRCPVGGRERRDSLWPRLSAAERAG